VSVVSSDGQYTITETNRMFIDTFTVSGVTKTVVTSAFIKYKHGSPAGYDTATPKNLQWSKNATGSWNNIENLNNTGGGWDSNVSYNLKTNWDTIIGSSITLTDIKYLDITYYNSDGAGAQNFDYLYVEVTCEPSAGDTTAPSAVTNLVAVTGFYPGEISLTWTSPGDDNWTGQINNGQYKVRYATYTTVNWNDISQWTDWQNKCDIIWSTSTSAMVTQNRTLTGLKEGTTYYVRLWTADEVPNWSAISNGATTQAEMTIVGIDVAVAEIDFGGIVYVGNSTMTVNAITVTNTGNVNETFNLRCATTTPVGSPWSMGGQASDDVFVLYGLFNSTKPVSGDYNTDDIIWNTNTLSDNTATYTIEGSYSGYGVSPSSATRNIWFKLDMPLTTSATYQQNISITIGAQK